MRLVAVGVVLAMAASASALPVLNGDFELGNTSSWTNWRAGWGVNDTVTTNATNQHSGTTCARLQINNGQGSFGIYQVVDVPTNQQVTLQCWVRATSNSTNWAEVMLFNYAVTNAGDIDSGTTSAPFLVWKRDSWTGAAGVPGGTLPTVATLPDTNSWEKVTKTLASVPSGKVTVAFKWGRSGASFSGSMYIDDVTVVPEPATALLLGLPLLFVRRRRRA